MYTSFGFGRISKGTFDGSRFKHVRDAATAEEVKLAKDAGADTDSKINLDFRIVGLLPSAPFPNSGGEWKTAKAYLLAFPHTDDPADDARHGTTFSAPTSLVEEDSLRMPAYAPAPAGATAPSQGTMVMGAPRPFTMPVMFDPGVTAASDWILAAQRALQDNNHDGQPDARKIGALLVNINPDVAAAAETLHGARQMTLQEFFDHLLTYKCSTNRVTTRAQIRGRKFGPGENWSAGIGKQIADMAKTHMTGDAVLKTWLEKQSKDRQEEVCQDIATTIIDSAPARAEPSLVDLKGGLVAQATDFAGLMSVHSRLRDQAQVIAGNDRSHNRPGVHHVDTTQPPADATPPRADGPMDKVVEILNVMASKIEAMHTQGADGGKKKRVAFVFDINKLPACKHCRDDPIAVNGGRPGHHFHKDCPNDPRG